jgi:hypothetical protein
MGIERPGIGTGSPKPFIYDPYASVINGQSVFDGADNACGLGTYSANGCAIIAIYNAMLLCGKPQDLDSITTEISFLGGMILGGLFGAHPWSFDEYFFLHGVSYSEYWSYDALLQDIAEGDIVVFTVMNSSSDISRGFHTMAAQYVGGQFIVCNYSNDFPTPHPTSSLNPIYGDSMWLYGYIIGG